LPPTEVTASVADQRSCEPAHAAKSAPSAIGRLLRVLLPLVKLRSQLRGITLGVRICVRDEDGRILLIRHSYLPGWHFPGGGVEFGETAAEAAHRELVEEGGVELTAPPRLMGLFRNPEWTAGDHVAFFEAGAWRPCERRWGVEIEGAGFFAEDDLPAEVHASVRRRLSERRGAAVGALW
jgi:ADP-ribose pyrophosphatase YjhB (NUDIX family)